MTMLSLTLIGGFGLFLIGYIIWRLYFLRNPKRHSAPGDHLLAPADGYVIYIKKITAGQVPIAIKGDHHIALSEVTDVDELADKDGLLIGILITPFSVHRNRAPIQGTVICQHYHKNKINLSMIKTLAETVFRFRRFSDNAHYLSNERLTTGLNTSFGPLYMTQIADQWINRIVSWVDIGDTLEQGEQYGMIRFGSQCDLFITNADAVDISTQVGDYVYAGETILATLAKAKTPGRMRTASSPKQGGQACQTTDCGPH